MHSRADHASYSRVHRRPHQLISAAGGLIAALIAWAGMWMLRSTLQVRTLPERMMDWLLLFIPPHLFEAALRQFGFDAKHYALSGAVAAMSALLTALGTAALWQRWSGWALVAVAIGLWIVTMAVIMPLTGAGFFATALFQGTGSVVAGYLGVALAYAGTLALIRALADVATGVPAWRTWRSAAILTGGAVAAFIATPSAANWGLRPSLPEAVVNSSPGPVSRVGIASPSPQPNVLAAQPSTPVSTVLPLPSPTSTAAPTAAAEGQWNRVDLDATTNGNVSIAAELVAAHGVPIGKKLSEEMPATAPWERVGEVYEFSGIVGRVREYPVDGPEPRWANDQRPLSEVVLFDSPDIGLPIACVIIGSVGSVREGDMVSATGYIVGMADVENETGSITTGLVIVGEIKTA